MDIKTDKLLDEEAATAAARRAVLAALALEVEAAFLRENLTMGEMAEVLDLFNARAHAVFMQAKLQDIKDQYDRRD